MLKVYQCHNGILDIPTKYNGKNVVALGENIFRNDVNSVKIQEFFTDITDTTFKGASNINKLTVNEQNTNFYSKNNCIIEKSSNTLVVGCQVADIPTEVITIGNWAFYCRTNLKAIYISNTFTSISETSFSGCTKIEKFFMDSGNTNYIEDNFCIIEKESSKLIFGGSDKIPNNVVEIGPNVFQDMINIKSTILPSSVRSIDSNAFLNCSNLKEIFIPTGVEKSVKMHFLIAHRLKQLIFLMELAY